MGQIQFRINRGKYISSFNKEYPVYLRYTNKSEIFEVSIDFKVQVKSTSPFYDKTKGNCKPITRVINMHSLNSKIIELTKHFNDQDRLWAEKSYKPSKEEIKSHYLSWVNKGLKPTKMEFLGYFENFIELSKIHPNASTGKVVSPSTLKGYKGTKAFFEKYHKESPMAFSNFNLDWYNNFVDWSFKNGLSPNTIGRHIMILKTVLNKAVDENLTNNTAFRHKSFKVLREEVDEIYLTEPELKVMLSLDYTRDKRRGIARDLFLIGAYTGLRISDYNNLSKANIITERGVRMFKVKTRKTGKYIGVPIHPVVQKILDKYKGDLPPSIPDQKLNKLIKEVGSDAELTNIVFIDSGARRKENNGKYFKFELITSHTARRSFATNAFLAGISSLELMRITGHKTESNFLKYIKATPEQVAIKMSEHSFFQD